MSLSSYGQKGSPTSLTRSLSRRGRPAAAGDTGESAVGLSECSFAAAASAAIYFSSRLVRRPLTNSARPMPLRRRAANLSGLYAARAAASHIRSSYICSKFSFMSRVTIGVSKPGLSQTVDFVLKSSRAAEPLADSSLTDGVGDGVDPSIPGERNPSRNLPRCVVSSPDSSTTLLGSCKGSKSVVEA